MPNQSDGVKKYFEDFEEGVSFEFEVAGLTVAEIKEFAERYDPQRFHLDEHEAAATHFGGLVASGFQTQLLCFEPFCRTVLRDASAVGSAGIDSLRWLRPWYAGEPLSVKVTLVDKRPSATRNDRGYLSFKLEAGADGVPTLVMEWRIIMLTRQCANKDSDMTGPA
jgi:acyl dehydratase